MLLHLRGVLWGRTGRMRNSAGAGTGSGSCRGWPAAYCGEASRSSQADMSRMNDSAMRTSCGSCARRPPLSGRSLHVQCSGARTLHASTMAGWHTAGRGPVAHASTVAGRLAQPADPGYSDRCLCGSIRRVSHPQGCLGGHQLGVHAVQDAVCMLPLPIGGRLHGGACHAASRGHRSSPPHTGHGGHQVSVQPRQL